jgi:hypothetical protein
MGPASKCALRLSPCLWHTGRRQYATQVSPTRKVRLKRGFGCPPSFDVTAGLAIEAVGIRVRYLPAENLLLPLVLARPSASAKVALVDRRQGWR